MKKLLFILPSLKAGGAERVISFLTTSLDTTRYNITLLVLGFEKDSVYPIDKANTVFLNKTRLLYALPNVIKNIKRIKPNIVLSSIGHINFTMGLLTYLFPKVHFIGREASVISYMNNYSGEKYINFRFLKKLGYQNLAAIICQSNDMIEDLEKCFDVKRDNLVLINNPITKDIKIKQNILTGNNLIRFITVGRLTEEKGHKRLMNVLSKIKDYDFLYTVIGTGPLSDELKELAKTLGIISKINFVPYTSQVLEMLAESDMFLQGSYVEGFPNAALESCSVGTPVLAFNAPGGTKEIIKDNVNGYIVENETKFVYILNDKRLITCFNRISVKEFVFQKFNSNKILKKYDELFESLK